jgi:tetratricopeptide (TPR) repeat protein
LPLIAAGRSFAQGANYTGNGGRNTIQGRIFLPSGQRTSSLTIRIRLESAASGDLTVFADTNGNFSFKNLNGGSYYVVIQDFEQFEDIRESAYIDDPGNSNVGVSSTPLSSTPRIVNVPIYLQLKRNPENNMPPGVVSAELAKAPAAASELFNKAGRSARLGNDQKAIMELTQALGIYPEFALAFNELGVLYAKVGERSKAIEAFRSAVRFSPQAFTPRVNLGCSLVEVKNNEEAAQQLNEAIKLNTSSIQVFFCMGKAQMQMQNLQYAERAFTRALELSGGNHSKAHYLLGGIYWSEKRYRQAADELEKYLKLEPAAKDAEQTRKTISDLRSRQN